MVRTSLHYGLDKTLNKHNYLTSSCLDIKDLDKEVVGIYPELDIWLDTVRAASTY